MVCCCCCCWDVAFLLLLLLCVPLKVASVVVFCAADEDLNYSHEMASQGNTREERAEQSRAEQSRYTRTLRPVYRSAMCYATLPPILAEGSTVLATTWQWGIGEEWMLLFTAIGHSPFQRPLIGLWTFFFFFFFFLAPWRRSFPLLKGKKETGKESLLFVPLFSSFYLVLILFSACCSRVCASFT